MAEGWIKLYRNIQEHWIWQDSQKLKWWLDILLLANHKDNKFLLGNELITIERGEHHTSELKLAERWGVSKTTVRKFLNLLESDHMIELKKSKKGTTLKVANYSDYQDFSEGEKTIKKPQKNHSVDHKETIKKPYDIPQKNHKVYTNNNEKNDKNDNNSSSTAPNYIEFFNNNFHPISFYEMEILNSFIKDGLNEEVILLALEKAVESNVRNIKYVKRILQNWLNKNIKTVEAVKAEEEQFKREKGDNNTKTVIYKKEDKFNNYDQRDYSKQQLSDLEKKLLNW
ncbi:DnaD domain protein [Clostridium niameyense]|uniref:DnaD domain protein n=1 Tax=Clostridium niameyense TaxID=1622073 RepID=A0A6M0RA88_9CLOT|nr:DnaD domain protein [Clostridium niameyense]NEZ46519.1 DnaD domain protein [Clostridium niameyense]